MKIVVLTGAGISAESGISTFRDSNGLWENHNIEEIATPWGWEMNPDLVLEFYNQRRRQLHEVSPNLAHYALAELEKHHEVVIITQNVDNLHERAGSTNIIHLHGELLKARDEVTDDVYDNPGDINLGDFSPNGYQLRPHIVWFHEPVPLLDKAVEEVRNADHLVVIGTSLVVYPAASLLFFTPPDCKITIIDKSIPETAIKVDSLEGSACEKVPQFVNSII